MEKIRNIYLSRKGTKFDDAVKKSCTDLRSLFDAIVTGSASQEEELSDSSQDEEEEEEKEEKGEDSSYDEDY